MATQIPRVNLRDYREGSAQDRQRFIRTVGEGLRDIGFLTVGGHGLDQAATAATYEAFEQFYALPQAVKDQYDVVAGGARGYTPFGREHAKYTKIPDLKEFWHVGQELPAGHPYAAEYPPNVWPAELPHLRDLTLKLYRAFEGISTVLLEAVAQFFGLPANCFADMMVDGNSILRVIHYPPIAEGMPRNAVRAAAHEDINLITLLIESRGGGLEILTQESNWMAVNALAGDIIADSGDMLSRVTNGVIPATTHRVVNPPEQENKARYSMPFFVHPYSACDLTVMDHFVDDAHPPKWPPIKAGEFLQERLREIGLTANK